MNATDRDRIIRVLGVNDLSNATLAQWWGEACDPAGVTKASDDAREVCESLVDSFELRSEMNEDDVEAWIEGAVMACEAYQASRSDKD